MPPTVRRGDPGSLGGRCPGVVGAVCLLIGPTIHHQQPLVAHDHVSTMVYPSKRWYPAYANACQSAKSSSRSTNELNLLTSPSSNSTATNQTQKNIMSSSASASSTTKFQKKQQPQNHFNNNKEKYKNTKKITQEINRYNKNNKIPYGYYTTSLELPKLDSMIGPEASGNTWSVARENQTEVSIEMQNSDRSCSENENSSKNSYKYRHHSSFDNEMERNQAKNIVDGSKHYWDSPCRKSSETKESKASKSSTNQNKKPKAVNKTIPTIEAKPSMPSMRL